jgi:hypothetical protein
MTGAGAMPGAARAAAAQLPCGHGAAGELSCLARQGAVGLLIAAARAAWPASGRTEGLGASWSPAVPGPGMTGCCQLAQPTRWVSVAWLTPPLSACRQLASAEAARSLGLLDRHGPILDLDSAAPFKVAQGGVDALPVGFQNSATAPDLAFCAARSYSLIRPPRTCRRLIRSWERSVTG